MKHTRPTVDDQLAARDSPVRVALRDARTSAMIASAYVRTAIRDGDIIDAADRQLLKDVTDILTHAQRISYGDDPDAD